jgi:hypothetical protein
LVIKPIKIQLVSGSFPQFVTHSSRAISSEVMT